MINDIKIYFLLFMTYSIFGWMLEVTCQLILQIKKIKKKKKQKKKKKNKKHKKKKWGDINNTSFAENTRQIP